MNVIIAKGIIFVVDGKLGVQKFVSNGGGIGAIFDSFMGGLIEFLAIRRKIFFGGRDCGIADFQKPSVKVVGRPENINQSALRNFVFINHRRAPSTISLNVLTSRLRQSIILQ